MNKGFLGDVSVAHREFGVNLPGECDSQDLALVAEGDKGGCPLVLLKASVMPGLVAPMAVTLAVCDTEGPFLRFCGLYHHQPKS